MFRLKKRGQITVFIILGILVLMTSAAYFYVKKQTTTFQPENIPTARSDELSKFTEECLSLKTREALNIVGSTGGYIEYPFLINNDPASYLKVSPISEAKMPYWWYSGQNRIPELPYIQDQVERYVETHIDECLNNFSGIPEYEIYKTGDLDVVIDFADSDVAAKMKYPLRAVKLPQRNEYLLSDYDFFVRVPIRFKEVHQTAKKIMEDENQYYFMEKFTIDLISLADVPNKDYTTPLMNFDFKFSPYIWKTREIKENLQTLINLNIQYIKFNGTEYVPYPESDDFTYMRNHYLWTFDQNPHENQHVSMSFEENWPFRISVSPTSGGEVLRSGTTQFGNVLSYITPIQTWHFTYDVVYPVVVTIRDAESKNNDEYVFSYAFLVSVQKNRPFRQNFASDVFMVQNSADEEEMCNYLTDSYNLPITVRTFDEYTKNPLRSVNLSFTCAKFTCPLGETDWSESSQGDSNVVGSSAYLKTNFPYCAWGVLKGTKEGYENAQMFMSANEEKSVDFYLKPVKEFKNYTLVKRFFAKDNVANQIGLPKELSGTESAVIIIRAANMTDQYISYPPQEEPTPIRLYKNIDYTYNVTIYLFDEKDDTLVGAFDAAMIPTQQEIEDSNTITFQTLEYRTSDEEELGFFLMGIKNYSQKIPTPVFEAR